MHDDEQTQSTDAYPEHRTQVIRLHAPGVRRFRSPLGAVVWVRRACPMRQRAIDHAAVFVGSGWFSMQEQVELYSRVVAIIGTLERDEQKVLELYADGNSLAAIDAHMRKRKGTARRLLTTAEGRVSDRLRAQDLLDV